MKHEMRLDSVYFDEIANGLETIETRLLDDKRKRISVEDVIKFYRRPEL